MTRLSSKSGCVFHFGSFELDGASLKLHKNGLTLKIPPQPAEVLRLLVAHAGEVVSRSEIQHQVWASGTHVDFELGLNYCMNRLRIVLGDSAQTPQFIETIPRLGYRFIAPVQSEPSSRLMLAVLPFDNLSGDPAQEYVSDGLTEEIITELGRLRPDRLGVIARYSATTCKKSGKPLNEIAAMLDVDHVLEGSVRREGQRVRISVQLIRAADQTHLWAETYEQPCSDVLAMQTELGQRVAEALAIELLHSPSERRRSDGTVDSDVYDCYLRGRFHWNTWSVDSLQLAATCFQQAIDKSSKFAPAYSGLADSLSMLGFFNLVRPHVVYPRALRAAHQAVALDDKSAEAHASLAWAKCCYEWDWDVVGREFERATALNPNYVQAHAWYAFYLTIMDRMEEALEEIRYAKRLDPLSVVVNTDEACFLYFAGKYEEAVQQCQRTIALNPGFGLPYHKLGLCYLALGQLDKAIAAFERASAHWEGHSIPVASLASALAAAGETTRAREVLVQLERTGKERYVSPLDLSFVSLAMGDIERGMTLLEQAYDERDSRLPFIRVAPGIRNLSEHPRFRKILDRIGLAEERALPG
ncbi:MAG TPA: tetratricopeptide repeat protein [Terriglobales bacterium]